MNYYISSPDSSSSDSYYDVSLSFGSRPQSTSPSLAHTHPALAKLRQDACRGFDAEDDNEFCPALAVSSPYAASAAAAVAPGFRPSASYILVPQTSTEQDLVPTVAVRERKALQIIDPATGLPIRR